MEYSFELYMSNSVIWVVMLLASLIIYVKYYFRDNNIFYSIRQKRSSYIFGFLVAIFFVTGHELDSFLFLNKHTIFHIVFVSIIVAPLVGICYLYLSKYLVNAFATKTNAEINDSGDSHLPQRAIINVKTLFILTGTIVLFWIPVYLALYPGVFGYDIWQIKKGIGEYNTIQPFLHTFFMQFFYYIVGNFFASRTIGVACAIFVQMIIFAISCSYTLLFLKELGINKGTILGVFLFYSLMPIISISAVCVEKDVLFVSAYNILYITACRICINKELLYNKSIVVIFVIMSILTAHIRNNALYAVILMDIMFAITLYKNKSVFKRFLLMAAASIALTLLMNSALITLTQAQKDKTNFIMFLPNQQLARLYKYNPEIISEEDSIELIRLMPNISNYDPHKADGVTVDTADITDLTNLHSYLRLYFKYGLRKPNRYIEAFLFNTEGFWYLDDISSSVIYKGAENEDDVGYFHFGVRPGFDVEHRSVFPKLETVLRKLFHDNMYQRIPGFATLFSLALYFWLFVLCVFKIVESKKYQTIAPLVLVVAYILTLFAGPCALVRYAIPYIVVLPTIMAMLGYDESGIKENG